MEILKQVCRLVKLCNTAALFFFSFKQAQSLNSQETAAREVEIVRLHKVTTILEGRDMIEWL